MKQQIRFMIVIVVLLLLSLTLIPPLAAQDAQPTQVRFAHLVWGGVPVNVYIDDVAFTGDSTAPTVLAPDTVSRQYAEVAADEHTFAVVPDGEAMEAAIFAPEELTVEAGHSYLLVMMGNTVADDLHFTLIDETAGLADLDFSVSAATLFINNLYGIPAIDLYFAGELWLGNLAYGDYAFLQDPTEGSGSLVTAHGDPETIISQYDAAVGSPPNYFALWTYDGSFPGTLFEDYGGIYDGRFAGGLTITDGGTIAVGDEVTMDIEIGHRIQYTLTLEAAATLDIMLTENDETNVADPSLRVYNEAGEQIAANDELSLDDNLAGVWNAGLQGLTLEAGTYNVEAASSADVFPGTFTLSVSASE